MVNATLIDIDTLHPVNGVEGLFFCGIVASGHVVTIPLRY